MTLKKLATVAVIAVTAAAFVVGSAVSSEAKGKKKTEAAPKRSVSCTFTPPSPVCATKGTMNFTYNNACYAGNDGAVVKSDKACPAAKAMKSGKKKSGMMAAKKKK